VYRHRARRSVRDLYRSSCGGSRSLSLNFRSWIAPANQDKHDAAMMNLPEHGRPARGTTNMANMAERLTVGQSRVH
jgi:hypothetical protein